MIRRHGGPSLVIQQRQVELAQTDRLASWRDKITYIGMGPTIKGRHLCATAATADDTVKHILS